MSGPDSAVAPVLRAVSLTDPVVEPLLEALAGEYQTRYGSGDEMKRVTAEEFEPPAGLFLVVQDGGRTVAGGGFRRIDSATCEIKRMWTDAAERGRGLAHLVLEALEREAAAVGYRHLILETGPRQPEAERLYTRRGYRRIPHFGPYPQALAFGADLPHTPPEPSDRTDGEVAG
jgi:GNAT superfamily N-acetyltransferase